jgi:hypothetical protein
LFGALPISYFAGCLQSLVYDFGFYISDAVYCFLAWVVLPITSTILFFVLKSKRQQIHSILMYPAMGE